MRNMSKALSLVGFMCVLAVPLTFGAASVPFEDGFETSSVDANWTSNGTGAISFPSDTPDGAGSKSCSFTYNELTLTFTAGPYSNVWAQVYTKASGMSDEPLSTDIDGCTAVFYVGTNGHVYAMNGDGANGGSFADVASLTDAMSGNLTDWIGFVVNLDYANDTYDLYLKEGGTANADTLTRIASGYGFRLDADYLTNFVVATELQTVIDAVAMGTSMADAGNTALGTIDTSTEAVNTSVWQYVAIDDHGLTGAHNALAGDLGKALMSAAAVNDTLKIFTSNGWNQYTLSDVGLGPVWDHVVGYQPEDIDLYDGDVALILYRTEPDPTFNVYKSGYKPEDEDTAEPPDPPASGYTIYGTDNAQVNGWSTFVYGGADGVNMGAGLNDTNVGADNARAFIRNSGSRVYDYRYRLGSTWMKSGSASPFSWQKGQAAWIKSNLAGDGNYNP